MLDGHFHRFNHHPLVIIFGPIMSIFAATAGLCYVGYRSDWMKCARMLFASCRFGHPMAGIGARITAFGQPPTLPH